MYQVGETVHWPVAWSGQTNSSGASYRLLKNGLTEIGQDDLNFINQNKKLTNVFDAPGTILVEVKTRTAGGQELIPLLVCNCTIYSW